MTPAPPFYAQISLDKSLPGYLTISDITAWTTGQRNLFGIMMFWSSDNFVADFSVLQSNSNDWTVPVVAQTTYNIYGYYCYAWDVTNNITFAQGDIVWYNGYFYILYSNGTPNPNPPSVVNNPAVDTANWTPLIPGATFTLTGGATYTNITAEDIYNLAVASLINVHAWTATAITYIDAEAFTLTKTDCLKWNIHVNIVATIARIRILNYDSTLLSELDIPAVGSDIPIDLTQWGDGSYQVEIAHVTTPWNLNIPLSWTLVYIPILEVCQANACYVKLFKYTLCKCDDPCDDCEDMRARLHDMRMIRELITTINQMVNLYRSIFIGIYPVSTTQADLLTDIGQMIDKLKLITDRCGLCGSGSNDLTCS